MPKILFVDNSRILAEEMTASKSCERVKTTHLVFSQSMDAPVTPEVAQEYLQKNSELEGIVFGHDLAESDVLSLLKILREKHSKSEVFAIAVVDSNDLQTPLTYIEAGASDFIRAPFSTAELWFRITQNKTLLSKYNGAVLTNLDYLTQLINRRYFYQMAEKLFASYERGHIHLTCAMIDIDHFVFLNDAYGEETGDLIIQHVADILRNRFRKTDLLTRYLGKKFCILNVNLNPDFAFSVFDELRSKIEMSPFVHADENLKLTISAGVYGSEAKSLEELIRKAAVLLQTARKQGNRVFVE